MLFAYTVGRLRCLLNTGDKMNFGMTEVLIIALIIIFLFGAKKLPELAKSLGSSVKSFKKGLDESQEKENQDSEK